MTLDSPLGAEPTLAAMDSIPLLPIGAFSNATQLSAKALRLYAEHGILLPTRIDSETGYRYYRPEQVREARLVRLLRALDLSLAQIAELMAKPTAVEAAIKRQMDALAHRYTQQQSAYHAVLALLYSTPRLTAHSVSRRDLPSAHTLIVRFEANSRTLLARAGALLARVHAELGTRNVASESAFIPLAAAVPDLDEISLELCIPLTSDHVTDGTEQRDWPGQPSASADIGVQDGVPDLIAASDALFDWFDCHGVSLGDTPRLHLHPHTPQLVWPISQKETS